MPSTIIVIQQGTPVVVTSGVTFLGTGSAGDRDACRRLVFPSTVSNLLAPITYSTGPRGQCMNPTRTFNLDNTVLPHPTTQVVKTLTGSRTIRQEETATDVIVTEVWAADSGLSMPTPMFRLLYEYLVNGALIGPTDDKIQWEPRDRSDRIYTVDLLSLTVGSGEGETRFDVTDVRGLDASTSDFDNALTTWNAVDAGIIDREVRLRMRIIADVTP